MNDLKFILSNNKKKSNIIKQESNINTILDLIDKESSILQNNWNKLSKSRKKKLLYNYILQQKNKYNLTDKVEEELRIKLFNEFTHGNIKSNDIILDSNGNIDNIKPLIYNNEKLVYNYVKKNTYLKSNTKSKTNIERILK